MRKPYHSSGHLAKILISSSFYAGGGGGGGGPGQSQSSAQILSLHTYNCAADTGNVGSRYNQPFGPPALPPSSHRWAYLSPSLHPVISLLAHSVGFVGRQSEIAIGNCQINFFLHKLRSVKCILTKSCLHFKVICLIFYQ